MTATATVSMSLPSGRVPFAVTVDEAGKVTEVSTPQSELPEAAWKLTYGPKWAEVRQRIDQEAEALVYRVEVMIWQTTSSKSFGAIRRAFRDIQPAQLSDLSPLTEWQRLAWFVQQRQLTDLCSNWPATFRDALGKLDRLVGQNGGTPQNYPSRLQEYLLTQLPLQDTDTRDQIYSTLGHIGDDRIRELLLSELERPGRHNFTQGLLTGLRKFRDPDTRDRLLRLYESDKMTEEHVPIYLDLLRRLDGSAAEATILRILVDHPGQGRLISQVLRDRGWKKARIAALLRGRFDKSEGYYDVLHLMGVLNDLGVEDTTVDLATLNDRLDDPQFTDLPPVAWPQQLDLPWRRLLAVTDPEVQLQVIERYLRRPEPRLQRNALLQLALMVGDLPKDTSPELLPLSVERRVRELIAARYDKVYTLALKVLGSPLIRISEPDALLDSLIDRSLQKLYRIMVIQAMRRLIESSSLSWQTVWERYLGVIERADAGTLSGVQGFLIYLKNHGDTGELRRAIEIRRAALAQG